MQHYAAFHMGLHCLQKYLFKGFLNTKDSCHFQGQWNIVSIFIEGGHVFSRIILQLFFLVFICFSFMNICLFHCLILLSQLIILLNIVLTKNHNILNTEFSFKVT